MKYIDHRVASVALRGPDGRTCKHMYPAHIKISIEILSNAAALPYADLFDNMADNSPDHKEQAIYLYSKAEKACRRKDVIKKATCILSIHPSMHALTPSLINNPLYDQKVSKIRIILFC